MMLFTHLRTAQILLLMVLWMGFRMLPGEDAAGQVSMGLQAGEVPGVQIVSTERYSDQTLYGYIDGGAEIYREYGFRELVVQELRAGEEELLVEIYRMRSPLAAFGRFSLQRRGCTPAAEFPQWSCQNPYQLTVVKGAFIVSVTNYSGSRQAGELSQKIMKQLLLKIPTETVHFPALMEKAPFRTHWHQLLYVAGPLGLRSVAADWEKWFPTENSFDMFLLPLERQNQLVRLALIRFTRKTSLNTFLNHFQPTDDPLRYRKQTNSRLILVRVIGEQKALLLEQPLSVTEADSLQKLLDSLANSR